MLKERLTAKRWAVSLDDPALLPIAKDAPEKLGKYARTRNIEDLGGLDELDKLPEPPTLFELSPMLAKYEHVDEPFTLVQFHVHDIKNAPDSMCAWETSSDHRYLTEAAIKAIPRETVLELASVIRQLASYDGDSTPFTAPDGWSGRMDRRVVLSAIAAHDKETA